MARKVSITKDAGSHLSSSTNSVGTMLALSGGGVKGVMQLQMLAEMESQAGKIESQAEKDMPISKMFQTFAGTSVGGLIAVLLTIPKEPGSTEPRFSAAEALKMVDESASKIFPQHWYHVGKIGRMFNHQYSQKNLKELLYKHLGDMELGDLLGRVLITTFDLEADDPIKIFDSHNAPGVKAKDVVLATTAAPTYFKSVKLNDENDVSRNLVDGGVGYNRPAAEVLKYLKSGLNREQQGEMLYNMKLVSLNFQAPYEEKKILSPHFDGIIPQLANGLMSDAMKAGQHAATKEVKQDLAEQFTEFLLPVPKGSTKLDNSNPKNMTKLKEAAEKYIEDNNKLIKQLCATLVKDVNAREESSKLHEAQISVEESSVPSENSKTNDNIDKKGQDKDAVNTHVISKEFEAKLAINLSEKQVDALKDGLMKLTSKEYDVLQAFLKGLNDAQLVALSEHLPFIADGNFANTKISEFTTFQNKFLKFFSSMFEHEDNIINDTILSCVQEYHNEEVGCDGRGSDSAHLIDMVY